MSSLILLFLVLKYLDWKRNYPVYIIFYMLLGLLHSAISQNLVYRGFLAFPDRPFHWTSSNVIFDIIILPSFELLMVSLAAHNRRHILLFSIFVGWMVFQDLIISSYTSMLELKKWTLLHTAIGSILLYWASYLLFNWLLTHFNKK